VYITIYIGAPEKSRANKSRMYKFAIVAVAVAAVAAQRTYDGTDNNPEHPEWGSAGQPHARRLDVPYPPYHETRATRPGARFVSNEVFGRKSSGGVDPVVSELVMAWGQFVDHDITLTGVAGRRRGYGSNGPPTSTCPFAQARATHHPRGHHRRQAECGIPVPACDTVFDPGCTGAACLPFQSAPGDLVNEITAWLDGSQVYGSSETVNDALRDPDDRALLRVDPANPMVLPSVDEADPDGSVFDMANPVGIEGTDTLRAAGDVRANENPLLLSLHTLFVREHNRYVGQLRHEGGTGQDPERLFERARTWVIGLLQVITWNEYLPAVLGRDRGGIGPYGGFRPDVNPAMEVSFASALFRFGHSQVGPVIHLDTGAEAHEVLLRDVFFRPNTVTNRYGVDAVLMGASAHPAQLVDASVVDELRNVLFNNGSSAMVGAGEGAGGTDLVALNLERGRSHGVPRYTDLRQAYGLPVPGTWEDIGADLDTTRALRETYGPDVGRLDAIVGALAESPVGDARVGPLLRAALADQFGRLRDGDRFWWESGEHEERWQRQIGDETLGDVIERNRDKGSGITKSVSKSVMRVSSAPAHVVSMAAVVMATVVGVTL
jgi:hypothetical protein